METKELYGLSKDKKAELSSELSKILNRLSIDNELGTPDFILADMITTQIDALVLARKETFRWSGKSLKKIQLELQGVDEVVKDEAVEEEPFHIVGSIWTELSTNRNVKILEVKNGKTYFKYLDNDFMENFLTSNFLKDFSLSEEYEIKKDY